MTMVLCIEEVVKRYSGLTAIDRVSLNIETGQVVGLIGANGAGKTTLVQMISGYCRVDEGRILLGNRNITDAEPHTISRLGIARTFQNIRLFPEMTVLENVAIGGMYSASRSEFHKTEKNRASPSVIVRNWFRSSVDLFELDVLESLGIKGLAARRAQTLSYGDQRRVEIARAMAAKPQVLLLDEPAAGMSNSEADELGTHIRSIAHAGVAVLLIEHNVALVSSVADVICVMNQGKRIALGSPSDVLKDPLVIESYIGVA